MTFPSAHSPEITENTIEYIIRATLILEVVLSCRLVLNLRESHTRSNIGPARPKWSESVKLRSGISSGENQAQVHSFDKAVPSPAKVEEIGYSPDKKISPLQETWSAV